MWGIRNGVLLNSCNAYVSHSLGQNWATRLTALSLAIFSPACRNSDAQNPDDGGLSNAQTRNLIVANHNPHSPSGREDLSPDVRTSPLLMSSRYSPRFVAEMEPRLLQALDSFGPRNRSPQSLSDIETGLSELLEAYQGNSGQREDGGDDPDLLITLDKITLQIYQHPYLPPHLRERIFQEFLDRLALTEAGWADTRLSALQTVYAALWSQPVEEQELACVALTNAQMKDEERLLRYDDNLDSLLEYTKMAYLPECLGFLAAARHTLASPLPRPYADDLTNSPDRSSLIDSICDSPSLIQSPGERYWLLAYLEHLELNPYTPRSVRQAVNTVFSELLGQGLLAESLARPDSLYPSVTEALSRTEAADQFTPSGAAHDELAMYLRGRIRLLRSVTNGQESRSEAIMAGNFERLLKLLKNDRGLNADFDYATVQALSALSETALRGDNRSILENPLLLAWFTPRTEDSPELRYAQTSTAARLVLAGNSTFNIIFETASTTSNQDKTNHPEHRHAQK